METGDQRDDSYPYRQESRFLEELRYSFRSAAI